MEGIRKPLSKALALALMMAMALFGMLAVTQTVWADDENDPVKVTRTDHDDNLFFSDENAVFRVDIDNETYDESDELENEAAQGDGWWVTYKVSAVQWSQDEDGNLLYEDVWTPLCDLPDTCFTLGTDEENNRIVTVEGPKVLECLDATEGINVDEDDIDIEVQATAIF